MLPEGVPSISNPTNLSMGKARNMVSAATMDTDLSATDKNEPANAKYRAPGSTQSDLRKPGESHLIVLRPRICRSQAAADHAPA